MEVLHGVRERLRADVEVLGRVASPRELAEGEPATVGREERQQAGCRLDADPGEKGQRVVTGRGDRDLGDGVLERGGRDGPDRGAGGREGWEVVDGHRQEAGPRRTASDVDDLPVQLEGDGLVREGLDDLGQEPAGDGRVPVLLDRRRDGRVADVS